MPLVNTPSKGVNTLVGGTALSAGMQLHSSTQPMLTPLEGILARGVTSEIDIHTYSTQHITLPKVG